MKKLAHAIAVVGLIATPALAADMARKMPVKAPPPPPAPAPVYNWTGWYVGLNAGYGWGSMSFNLTGDNQAGQKWIDGLINSNNGSFNASGFVGGGQVGYNWQINQTWVTGVEADINYANLRGGDTIGSSLFNSSL